MSKDTFTPSDFSRGDLVMCKNHEAGQIKGIVIDVNVDDIRSENLDVVCPRKSKDYPAMLLHLSRDTHFVEKINMSEFSESDKKIIDEELLKMKAKTKEKKDVFQLIAERFDKLEARVKRLENLGEQ